MKIQHNASQPSIIGSNEFDSMAMSYIVIVGSQDGSPITWLEQFEK